MAIEVNSEIIESFLKARRELQLTQLELSEKAKIALRTIKDIESGRRTSFNESTLIMLCRALNLDYEELFGNIKQRRFRKRVLTWSIVSGVFLVVIIAGYSVFKPKTNEGNRTDWVTEAERLQVSHFNPDWGDKDGINVNYFHPDRVVKAGTTIPVDIKWSYHFREGSTPKFYISAYTEWNPDKEIRIFEGVLSGESSDTLNFEFACPKDPELYEVRVFFASSFGPVPSFYGQPPPNQLSSPSSARYLEIPIEVIR